jgi:hypothetical protein
MTIEMTFGLLSLGALTVLTLLADFSCPAWMVWRPRAACVSAGPRRG